MEEKKGIYPKAHFAPGYGWMNDPNGLIYHDGRYELYFQYNPGGIEWDQIAWGHAHSRDLVHWTQEESVLFADETGPMFSGCGIVNDRGLPGYPKDALVFFYTAASALLPEKERCYNKIMTAISTDGGRTLQKTGKCVLQSLALENRDPKVFYHEESRAYILVLYLDGHDFGIFRSEDLEEFQLSDRIALEGGFECPDLFRLPVEGSKEEKWVFWAGDGSYYAGNFDGYHFVQEQSRQYAYGARALPYAAQSWSGTPKGQVLNVAWLNSGTVDQQYTGVFSLPRQLSLVKREEGEGNDKVLWHLKQTLPHEIAQAFQKKGVLSPENTQILVAENGEGAGMLRFLTEGGEDFAFTLDFEGDGGEIRSLQFAYHASTGNLILQFGKTGKIEGVGKERQPIEILYDQGIVEISTAEGEQLRIRDLIVLREKEVQAVRLLKGAQNCRIQVDEIR